MLILSRRVGEEIVIDGRILVTVVSVKGNVVRLGITAPSSVTVDRREVHERRAEFAALPENETAALFSSPQGAPTAVIAEAETCSN
jgi:carbon storage regulator